jgi:hypothetical protein
MESMKDTPPVERLFSLPGFGLFLALAIFACFPEVLTGVSSFHFRDYGNIGYPNVHYLQQSIAAGEFPLWNPFSHCGVPFFAQWGVMAAYPLMVIPVYLPLPWSLSLFCFLHLWLGGVGMYLLARRWTANGFAAAVAGTGYTFSGVMFASFIWPNYFVGLAWMPFVVLLTERAWREGGRWIGLAASVAACQLASGVPEIVLLTWIIVGVLWICDFADVAGNAGRVFLRLASVVLLAAALMAVQMLPFFDLLAESQRTAGTNTTRWSLPVWGAANFIVPLLNCFRTPQGQYFQYGQEFLSSVYLGVPVVVLALVGVIKYATPRTWALLLLAVLFVVLAFGDNTGVFPALASVLPGSNMARYPVKFLFGVAFILPLLASLAVRAVHVEEKLSSRALAYTAAAVAVTGGALVWMANNGMLVDTSAWPAHFRTNVEQSNDEALRSAVIRGGILLVVVIAILYSARRTVAGALAGVVALTLLVFDGRTHAPNQNPTLAAAELSGVAWNNAAGPQPKIGEARVFITPAAERALVAMSSTNRAELWRAKRQAEWSNLNLLDSVPKVNGAATLRLREQAQFEAGLYGLTNIPAGVLDFLGAAYQSGDVAGQWRRRESALPMITAGQSVAFATDEQARQLVLSPAFDPRRMIVLPAEARTVFTSTNAAVMAVKEAEITPHRIVVKVEANEPGPLVIAQSYSRNWRASVDGADAVIHRANSAFQAVLVPAGKHEVRIEYREPWLRSGAAVSGIAVLVLLVVLFVPTDKSENR